MAFVLVLSLWRYSYSNSLQGEHEHPCHFIGYAVTVHTPQEILTARDGKGWKDS
jgi:hypothetical protein